MEEKFNKIVENISFKKKQLFKIHLDKCLSLYFPEKAEEDPRYTGVIFRIQDFFKGFTPFINEHGKDKKYEAGVEVLNLIFEELELEIDKEECFMIFHLRDLGKFRKKESDFLKELKGLWGTYKDYKLDDLEFSHALRNLRNNKIIKYRKGNLHLNQNIILYYKN